MARKIVLVECCRLCPFIYSVSMYRDICTQIHGDNEIPPEVMMNNTIWERCPLDDAEVSE